MLLHLFVLTQQAEAMKGLQAVLPQFDGLGHELLY
jgi:hypothetical protein